MSITPEQQDLQARFAEADKSGARHVIDQNGDRWNRMPYCGGRWMMTEKHSASAPSHNL